MQGLVHNHCLFHESSYSYHSVFKAMIGDEVPSEAPLWVCLISRLPISTSHPYLMLFINKEGDEYGLLF